MRILRLDLEKYGAFEGRSLDFRPDARLHVVYGPNEAGKSSALAAVSDLLFGFQHVTDFAFRHATGDLRLGATIAAADGREVYFRRRKGKPPTIIGLDEKALREDLLAPFLGAMTRHVFERAFGLSADVLRDSGKDLLSVDGESGASLFAAASGMRGLEDLRKTLEAEADLLFRPQASKRRFNEEAVRYESARKSLAERELGQTAWKRLNEGIEALEERHGALRDRRNRLRTERARLERLARARAAGTALDQALVEFRALGDAPELGVAAMRELAERLDASEGAAQAATRAAEALRSAQADCASATVDEAPLAAALAIAGLIEQSGAYAKSQLDLPKVQREADALDDDLARLAARLGLRDVAAIEAATPTDAARATLKELIGERRDHAQAEAVRDRALAEGRERLKTLEAERGPEPPPDPRQLIDAFASLRVRLKPYERRAERAAERDREARSLAEAAARMSPAADLDRLAARPLPGPEAIARARKSQEALSADLARVAEGLAKDRADAARVEAELAALASGGSIASPEAIAAARDARDESWLPLRAHLLGLGELDASARTAGAAALDRATHEADRLADRAALDAGRVAQQAALVRRRAEHVATRKELEERHAGLVEARDEALRAWREAWSEAGVEPSSPEEMDAWRKEFSALIERRERHEERAAEVDRLDALGISLRPELEALGAACGLGRAGGLDPLALAGEVEARLAALSDRFRAASGHAARIAEVVRGVETLARDAEAAALKARALDAGWTAALPTVGLAPDAPLAAAEAALGAWGEAPGLLAERANRLQRIRGMARDADAFRDGVTRLVAAFAPELADLPPEAAARRLNDRLVVARAAEARRDETMRRLEAARRADEAAKGAAATASRALGEAASGLPGDADLRDLLARMAARDRLKAAVAERRAAFVLAGETTDEVALRAELADFEPDQAPAAIEALKIDEDHADAEGEKLYAELAAERAKREALGGAGAEEAAAEQRAAGAALAATAREWAVKRLAALLLGSAVERARLAERSPTLDRAAALFGTLTGGAFAGFAEAYDDDAPRLVARRASGETVLVSGLSEGTRDQFYLALRLAFLEDYAGRAEAPPFIGDDLLASFDEERAAHGLKALAEIGDRVQPILFTHHRAIVETARATLGAAVDVVEITR